MGTLARMVDGSQANQSLSPLGQFWARPRSSQTSKTMKIQSVLFCLVALLASCTGPSKPNPEMQKLHDEMMATGGLIKKEIKHKLGILDAKIQVNRAEGDSLVVHQLLFLRETILSIKSDVVSLEAKAEQIPGIAHHHDHSDPDHHHHHGKSPLEGMPEAELLELQKELHLQMTILKEKHDNLHVD